MSEVIKEENGFRVKLVLDEYPHEPDDDGQSPLLRISSYYSATAGHVMVQSRPTGNDDRIEEAAARWSHSSDHAKLEKYLRAFHGATQVKWYGPNQATDNTYITYDTPEWVEYTGQSYPLTKDSVNMDEWIAYLEGEVYGYVVERKVTEEIITRIRIDGTEISRYTKDTWEEIDSVWGFYGSEYAEQTALEALEAAVTDKQEE